MATTTPVWTDNVSIVAAATLARGSTTRGTIDLRAKEGARIFLFVGRTGVAVLTTSGVQVNVIPTLNNDGVRSPAPLMARVSQTVAAVIPTTTGSAAGDSSFTVSSNTGLAAGDYICVGQGSANEEYAQISKIASTTITVCEPLKNIHANAEVVSNKADIWVGWIPGGATYSVVFDYGVAGAGDSVRVKALAQTLDSYSTV